MPINSLLIPLHQWPQKYKNCVCVCESQEAFQNLSEVKESISNVHLYIIKNIHSDESYTRLKGILNIFYSAT